MVQDTIKCPKCGEAIKLSQAISKDIEVEIRNKYEKQAEEKIDSEIKKLKTKEQSLIKEYESREEQFNGRLLKERKQIEEKVRKDVANMQQVELVDLKEQLAEKDAKLIKAEQQELDLRKRQRDLEEKTRSMEIDVARRIDQERQKIADKMSGEVEERHRLKDAEKDKKLADAMRQMEEMKRKLEQGSQQTQGEVLELEMEARLKDEFPFDDIEPVEKGRKGGDVIHTVKTQTGRPCGKILWETKRTKDWNSAWLQKVKDDQRDARADLGVIVSEALPKGFHHFREMDGVWVTDIPSALPLALALRLALIKEERARQAQTGKEGKMEIVYNYLTGVEFRNRVQAIMEGFINMKEDLDAEKRSTEKIWARREKNIEKVIRNIAGMHGELESMAGALPAIKMLELPVDLAVNCLEAEKDIK